MYKVFIQNNSLSFIDSNQINDFNGIFLFEQLAVSRKEYVFELLHVPSEAADFYIITDKPLQLMERFFSDYEQVMAAGGIVECGGEVLLIKRHGKWDLPKGKIEKGETVEAAAIREVEEETGCKGLEIVEQLESTFHTYNTYGPDSIKKTHWFRMKTDQKTELLPQQEEGITEVKWVNKEEVMAYLENSYGSLRALIKDYLK